MKESRNKGSERRKIIARTRNQHMLRVHSPFSFTSFPSQFSSLQSFSALNDRVRHLLKVLGSIPFFDITKHYRLNRAKGWGEGMAAWQSLILCKPLLDPQGFLRTCLPEGGGPQVGELTCGGLPHLTCKLDQIKMSDYMDRRVTPPKQVTSLTWGPLPPCKQALRETGPLSPGILPLSAGMCRWTGYGFFPLYPKEDI